jgi:hypothetical protein
MCRAVRKPDARAVFLAVFSAVYLFPFVRAIWHQGDEGQIVFGAQLVAQGAVPYRDFFVENFGPGSFYLLAGFFRLFGTTWFAERLRPASSSRFR